jgi:hypothetical protein
MMEGNPAKYLKVVHFMIFNCSKKFTTFLYSKGVSSEIQYLPDGKFYRNI